MEQYAIYNGIIYTHCGKNIHIYVLYNGILFSYKKKQKKKQGNPTICYNMDEPKSIMLSEISPTDLIYIWNPKNQQTKTKNHKLTEKEVRLVVTRGRGRIGGRWSQV